jgi:AP-2 complex subunit sigma-1
VCRGKTRLAKWYAPYNDEEKIKLKGEVPFPSPPHSHPTSSPLFPPPPFPNPSILLTRIKVHRLVAPRDQKYQSNFVEFRNNKIVYRRYAGLFFCVCVDANDNELAYLEAIHFFVEVLDSFFGNVCELDLVFNFYKVRAGFFPLLDLGGVGREWLEWWGVGREGTKEEGWGNGDRADVW